MLRIFQNIRPFSSIYVFLAGLILRLPMLIAGDPRKNAGTMDVLGQFFELANSSFYISILGGLLIIFLQGLLFNKLCIDHDVIYTHSYLPAYFFMLLNSVFPENLFINPSMLVNFLILFSFFSMYRMYRMESTSVILFYTALFYGCASLIFPSLYSGFVFLIVGTIIFKNISLKDILSIISGYALPWLMLWSILFLAGKNHVIPEINYELDFNFRLQITGYAVLFYILILVSGGLFKTTFNYTKNNIKTRRITLYMIGNLAFMALIVLFKMKEYQFYFPLLGFSMSLQIAYFLMGSKAKKWKIILHYLLLFAIVISLYGEKFFKFN